MIEELVPERNWWERVYAKEDIYEFHKYEKEFKEQKQKNLVILHNQP